MAVATSSDAETIEIVLSRTGLSKYFLFKVNCGLVKRSKPAPDIFLYTAALLSVKPVKSVWLLKIRKMEL